jgi:hypothetical protein
MALEWWRRLLARRNKCAKHRLLPSLLNRRQRIWKRSGTGSATVSDFHAHTCPKCGEQGQFKIHFLGRLEHPECHWTGYMGTGSYIGFQISQILHSGMRAGVGMKEDSDRKGDRIKPLALATDSRYDLYREEISDQQAEYGGYTTRVIH